MLYSLFTDASGLPGRSGWGYVLRHPSGEVTTGQGTIPGLHVNRAELLAVLYGLDAIPEPAPVDVHTDSVYVIVRAKRRTHRGDLGEQLAAHKSRHQIKFIKVGAGRPHPDHTKAHHLAREAAFHARRTEIRP